MAAVLSRIVESGAIDPEVAAFQQFFGTLAANPSVQMIGVNPLGGILDLWVKLRDDDEGNEGSIYDALQSFRARGGETLVDLHVVFADERDEAYPSSVKVLYRRS